MQLTYQEAQLVTLIDRAVQRGALNPKAPTFTARELAAAMDDVTGNPAARRISERAVGPLLNRMGVFAHPFRRFRRTADLLAALPAWSESAEEVTTRHTHTEIPAFAPHLNTIR